MARSMLLAKGLLGMFWGEAVTTAVFILNRSPTRSLDGKTPYEVWYGERPAVSFLKTFGCMAHVKNTKPHLKKLDARSTPMIFVGYEAGSKACRMYNPVDGRVHVTRDVWSWDQDTAGSSNGGGTFTVEYSTHQSDGVGEAAGGSPAVANSLPTVADSGEGTAAPEHVEFAMPPANLEELVDAEHDENAPARFRNVDNVLGAACPLGLVPRVLEDRELLFTTAEEPTTFKEAEQNPCWCRAMLEEMRSIEDNKTWSLVDLPAGHKPIGLKRTVVTSTAALSSKARLVAKGYVQRQGIDFDEVFAPVARMESVRLLLALAACEGWEVHHMDVKSAFLNADLVEEVYVSQPAGFIVEGAEHKALYGLHQAPRAWNAKLNDSLLSLGFQKSTGEHGVYVRGTGSGRLIVGVYVDDLVITGRSGINQFKADMMKLFRMSDLGLLSYYLGLEVKQTEKGISIGQAAYAAKLLARSGMEGCSACTVPLEKKNKLTKKNESPAVNATEYRSIVGGLRYLVNTRPDLAYLVGFMSRFLEEPKEDHYAAVKHLLRYVAGTLDHGVFYGRGGSRRLVGYSDSDHAGDHDDRRSTSGVLYSLGSNPITWQSSKQKVVALSSCEAEYIAAAAGACQGVWLARLVKDLTGKEPGAPILKIDNKSAIDLSKNPIHHDQTKHIDTKFHYIRECVDEGKIVLEQISTQDQLADILTKPLGREKLRELCDRIGVVNLKHKFQD
ncbi:hypothetical protein U9M48_007990 [Paspalum notatum var. saurae]|uniref:Reverse transcriptase Ty1/copia-type domain-containing protein n=1 Tax=Paspalum notatum var. saurae TaxID=547442 RepID=A0AAQ3WCK6_PASNO